MTRITSIGTLFAIVSIYKHVVHQMNVKIAFLNGDLEDKIHMEQPEGCVVTSSIFLVLITLVT